MLATGPLPSMHANNVTLVDSVGPLLGASCSELVQVDCNYTRSSDRTTPRGRPEADLCDSYTYMLAMGPVANIHNKEMPLWRLRTARSTTDGSVGVT